MDSDVCYPPPQTVCGLRGRTEEKGERGGRGGGWILKRKKTDYTGDYKIR